MNWNGFNSIRRVKLHILTMSTVVMMEVRTQEGTTRGYRKMCTYVAVVCNRLVGRQKLQQLEAYSSVRWLAIARHLSFRDGTTDYYRSTSVQAEIMPSWILYCRTERAPNSFVVNCSCHVPLEKHCATKSCHWMDSSLQMSTRLLFPQ